MDTTGRACGIGVYYPWNGPGWPKNLQDPFAAPEACDVLVLKVPSTPYTAEEISAIRRYPNHRHINPCAFEDRLLIEVPSRFTKDPLWLRVAPPSAPSD